jgi:hypothetical protein
MKSIAVSFLLLGAISLFKGVFFDPSLNDGRRIVERYVEQVSHGNMRLAAFQSTAMTDCDEGVMDMAFEGSLECVGDDPAAAGLTVSFAFDRARPGDLRPMTPGDHRYIKGIIRFEKARFGWVGRPM